jgi:hypothetical protein
MELLRRNTDENHRFSQVDICKGLKKEYDTEVDRKTVSRHLGALLEYDEHHGKHLECNTKERSNGSVVKSDFYYRRDFSEAELRIIVDSILSNRHISNSYSEKLVERVELELRMSKGLVNKLKKNIVFYDDFYKPRNPDFFYIIENICDAIDRKKDISIRISKYDISKADNRVKRIPGSRRLVSPVQMIMLEQEYFLIALSRKFGSGTTPLSEDNAMIVMLSVSDIQQADVIEEKENNAKAIYKKMVPDLNATEMQQLSPYMDEKIILQEKTTAVQFVLPKRFINRVVSRFGLKIRAKELSETCWNGHKDEPLVVVTVNTSFGALRHFVHEHRGHIYVIDPIWMNYDPINERAMRDYEKTVHRGLKQQGILDPNMKRAFAHGYYNLRAREIDESPLSDEEKKQMKLLLAKMLGDDRNVNKSISEGKQL